MTPVDDELGDESADSVDRLIILLRAYITKAAEKPKKKKLWNRAHGNTDDRGERTVDFVPPSDWALVFDCETRTTPDQRLRFGAFQLRYKGQLWERGIFYESAVLASEEIAILRQALAKETEQSDGETIRLLTRAEFVEEVFYDGAYAVGAQIIGFNLPFDLSRLAIRHASARRSMRGGFSLTLSDSCPAIAVKHLSQRAAFIRVTGGRPKDKVAVDDEPECSAFDESEENQEPDRGYFVDVKTLAAALTSESHSLEQYRKMGDDVRKAA